MSVNSDILKAGMTFQAAGLVGNTIKKKKPVRSAIDIITGTSLLEAEGNVIAGLD